jgi:predicted peptidase
MQRIWISALFTTLVLLNTASLCAGQTPAPGKQVEQSLKITDSVSVPYLLYLPPDYKSSEKKQPLMLFLHGRGESNGPLSLVKKWGPPRMVERGDPFPYILVSPQCPRQDSWSRPTQQALLVQLLDFIIKTYTVDEDRVYLTGLSMGGYGSWRLAADHAPRFAAVAPICGAGKTEDAHKLKSLPIWVFHGDQDGAVPFNRSKQMVNAIKAAGGTKIRFTTLEHVGHNSWSSAYALPELYAWFNKHTVSGNRQ